MTLMNYHELTMNEARDSPARRKQFLVICAVMAGAFFYSVLTAGGVMSVEVAIGEFPGGDFIFKQTMRDYAASPGLARAIGKDINLKPKQFADTIYLAYLDDPSVVVNGRQQRFAAGLLANDDTGKDLKAALLEKNRDIIPATGEEFWDLSARELWLRLPYEQQHLPKTKAAVAQFPYTDGFVSSLILTYKIIPALHKYVQETAGEDAPVIVFSTCSTKDEMCTHYAPLARAKPFLFGNPEMKEYVKTVEQQGLFSLNPKNLKKVFPFVRVFKDMFGSKEASSDEL